MDELSQSVSTFLIFANFPNLASTFLIWIPLFGDYAWKHAWIHAWIHACMHACMHACIHASFLLFIFSAFHLFDFFTFHCFNFLSFQLFVLSTFCLFDFLAFQLLSFQLFIFSTFRLFVSPSRTQTHTSYLSRAPWAVPMEKYLSCGEICPHDRWSGGVNLHRTCGKNL